MKEHNHNFNFMVIIASIGAGMMALYPLSRITGIMGLIIFSLVVVIELFF